VPLGAVKGFWNQYHSQWKWRKGVGWPIGFAINTETHCLVRYYGTWQGNARDNRQGPASCTRARVYRLNTFDWSRHVSGWLQHWLASSGNT